MGATMKLPFGTLSCCCLLAAFSVSTTSSSDGAAWFDGGGGGGSEDRGAIRFGVFGPKSGPNISSKTGWRCHLNRIQVTYYTTIVAPFLIQYKKYPKVRLKIAQKEPGQESPCIELQPRAWKTHQRRSHKRREEPEALSHVEPMPMFTDAPVTHRPPNSQAWKSAV